MTNFRVDRGRITARVPTHVQDMLEMAASLVGATLNQFIVQVALREAERIIEQERVIQLSAQESALFINALDNPPPVNDTLLAALQDYAVRSHDKTGSLDWAPRPKQL